MLLPVDDEPEPVHLRHKLTPPVHVQTGFTTNQNLLVCAPTGAGKTNIAMIAVLREVSQHIGDDGAIQKDDFKIVYVAPMKALAAEVTKAFGSRLEALGLQVCAAFVADRLDLVRCVSRR